MFLKTKKMSPPILVDNSYFFLERVSVKFSIQTIRCSANSYKPLTVKPEIMEMFLKVEAQQTSNLPALFVNSVH